VKKEPLEPVVKARATRGPATNPGSLLWYAAGSRASERRVADGRPIQFAPGTYDPNAVDGRERLVHEVAPTNAPHSGALGMRAEDSDAHDREADAFDAAFMPGGGGARR